MILDKFKLDGKVAIVTGASRGLGQGMAIGLAEAGAELALVASSSTEVTATKIRALGRKVCQIKADLLDPKSIPHIINTTVKEMGGIDILINNAGTIRRAPVLEFSEKDWDDVLSFQGGIRVSSYTASKSAVMGLTRILANELAPHNINVNAIAPGYMETDNTFALRADEKRNAEILTRIPAGRWGCAEDLQGVAVFLASAASDYMQGFTVAVDGGWLAR